MGRFASLEQAEPPYERELLRAGGVLGLNCGSGLDPRADWLNVDIESRVDARGRRSRPGRIVELTGGGIREGEPMAYLEHDALEPFPFADGTFDWIYSEHFIEHVKPLEGIRWLREMRRLLAEGGTLRVTTPDLARYAEGYCDPQETFFDAHRRRLEARNREFGGPDRLPKRRAWMLNQIFQLWDHAWIYDLEELQHAARRAGFPAESLREVAFREGAIPELAALDQEWRSDETLYVELRV